MRQKDFFLRVAELIDVDALIAAGVPDTDGDVIPPGVSFGGYSVRKIGRRIHTPLITETLVFNRRTKTYLTFYNTCCWIFGVNFTPSLLGGFPGAGGQVNIFGINSCSGNQVNLTASGDFFSLHPPIATVGPHSGDVSFVAPGGTDIDGSLEYWGRPRFFLDACVIAFGAALVAILIDNPACGDVRDQIRQEYEVRLIPVPACGEFTQTLPPGNFFFAEMNNGDYSWAVITDRQLTRLEQTRVNVGNQPINVISGYRNPSKNDSVNGRPLSRHQYGDAADSCPSDYNGDGVVNSADQAILATEGALAGFTEIDLEPLICVHLGSL